jgi:hypothetical protein
MAAIIIIITAARKKDSSSGCQTGWSAIKQVVTA